MILWTFKTKINKKVFHKINKSMKSFIGIAIVSIIFSIANVHATPGITSFSPTHWNVFEACALTINGIGFDSISPSYIQIGSLPQALYWSIVSSTRILAQFDIVEYGYSNLMVKIYLTGSNYIGLSGFNYVYPSITDIYQYYDGQRQMYRYISNWAVVSGSNWGSSSVSENSWNYFCVHPTCTTDLTWLDSSHVLAYFTGYPSTDYYPDTASFAWGTTGAYTTMSNGPCWCCNKNIYQFCATNTCWNSAMCNQTPHFLLTANQTTTSSHEENLSPEQVARRIQVFREWAEKFPDQAHKHPFYKLNATNSIK